MKKNHLFSLNQKYKSIVYFLLLFQLTTLFNGCLPASDSYPNMPPAQVVSEAQALSDSLASYIYKWTKGKVSSRIPDGLIPKGISDCKNFYLKNPDSVTASETWAVRYAKPIDKDSLYAGIPDPKITYLLLGTALAPFGSKLVIEGEFPHARFFSIQVTPPLNGKEYYAQRQFGTAEVSIVDADIEPEQGNVNPYRIGADRNAKNRHYKVEFDLTTGNPTTLNDSAHTYPYRKHANNRKAGLMVYQGPLGYKTIVGTPLPADQQGPWDLGNVWVRIYEPDKNTDALGGVAMPKVYFQLPSGEKYFIGSDFSRLVKRANTTIANRSTTTKPNPYIGPEVGWFKSWGITRSILNGVCISNNWTDSASRVREIDLGWTGRGEFQPPPGNIEPHATTNNYVSYLGRTICVQPGMVAVLTGKLPTFPSTKNGESVMTGGQVRYWSICGIDQDPLSPLPATTIHAISDDDVIVDSDRNYVIAYSRPGDRPGNAKAINGVSWVDWGVQSELGVLMRWLCVAPDWRFSLAPHEHNLDFSHSDFAATLYDKTLIGQNWREGFMKCYLPRVHYMTKAEFEAIGSKVTAENVPVWVDSSYSRAGMAESRKGTVIVSGVIDASPSNAGNNLNDGNPSTFWSGPLGQPLANVVIDLGSIKKISAIKLNWDWVFFGKNYQIGVSDDNISYRTIFNITNENGQVDLYKNLKDITGRYVKLNLTAYNAGYYRLAEFEVYTGDCNCSAPVTATVKTITKDLTAVLYPSPAKNVITIKSNFNAKQRIVIYDFQGKIMQEQYFMGESATLDIKALPEGAYFAILYNQKKRVVKKFFKFNG